MLCAPANHNSGETVSSSQHGEREDQRTKDEGEGGRKYARRGCPYIKGVIANPEHPFHHQPPLNHAAKHAAAIHRITFFLFRPLYLRDFVFRSPSPAHQEVEKQPAEWWVLCHYRYCGVSNVFHRRDVRWSFREFNSYDCVV